MLLRALFLLCLASYTACNPSVIIIGAGASGIAAATRLFKNGFTNITVLEAEDRIGGRIYSIEFDHKYVDLGAEWCHGEEDNVVYDIVKDLGILRVGPTGNPHIYHSELKKINKNFSDALMETFNDVYNNPEKTNASLGEYISKRYKEVIKKWENDADKYRLAQEAMSLFETYVAALEGAFSLLDVATNNDYLDCDGEFHLNWNGLGYRTILNVMMQKYPDQSKALPIDDKILLKKRVKEIRWDGKQAVVTCADESKYSADHVVVTVSLGVLKHDLDTLFNPKLPDNKVKAIDQLGIAAIHKVLLHFPLRWWNDTDILGFIWDNKTKLSYAEEKKLWITSLSSVTSITHNSNFLEAWFTGSLVLDIEQMTDEVIADGFMQALIQFGIVDPRVLVRPDSVFRNKWYANPNFRGTYSFQTLRSRRGENSDEVILSKPLGNDVQKPNLLFAGEATNPTHYSTVHGAIETGFREADRIIQMYKK